MNATNMCKTYGKFWDNYYRTAATFENAFLDALFNYCRNSFYFGVSALVRIKVDLTKQPGYIPT